jgi:hypothetical protein
MKEADIHGLIEQFDTIRKFALRIYNASYEMDINDFSSEIDELNEQYDDAVDHFEDVKGDSITTLKWISRSSEYYDSDLMRIMIGSSKALGVLKKLIFPSLTH